jgi:hypothetical protein
MIPKTDFRTTHASESERRLSNPTESENKLCPHLRFAIAQRRPAMSDLWSIWLRGNAFIDFTESRMKAARVVLRVEAEEYGKLGMPDRDFREIMRTKIEEFVYSLEFSALQRDALEAEFLWSAERERPASVAPTDVSLPEETPSSIKLTAGQRVRAFIEEHDLDVLQFAGMIKRGARIVGYVLADTPVGKKTQAAVARELGTTREDLFPE